MEVELIAVFKSGDYLEVHPTALAQHKKLGWVECERAAESQAEVLADEPSQKRRGRPPKPRADSFVSS